jgi:predicted O-methyltransferase YrrM
MRVAEHFVLWALGQAKAETQTTEAERAALARAVSGRRRAVEIGVWHGVTTSRLRSAMDPTGVLYAVDPFEPGRMGFSFQWVIAHREVARVKGAEVRWIRRTGSAAASMVLEEGLVDFVFIDGDHSYDGLRADWLAWAGAMETSGIIALHDSISGPQRSIDDAGSVRFTRDHVMRDPNFEPAGVVDSLSFWRRR